MGEQFLHDEVVVNFPSQLSPLLHRFQFLVTFNLQGMREQKRKKTELVDCGITVRLNTDLIHLVKKKHKNKHISLLFPKH